MKTSHYLAVSATALFLAAGPVSADSGKPLVGEKIDSGLGELPHYSKWADHTGRLPTVHRVPGESLDDGLGELPHYSKWVDRTGRDPLGRKATQVIFAKR